VFQAYRDVIQTVVDTSRRVATTYATATNGNAQQRTTTHRLSVEAQPFLLDHCFFRQPANWRNVSDRFPVVPLTMLIELMSKAAQDLAPEQSVVYLEHLRAYKWLAVEPPVEVKIKAARLDPERIKVQIEGYCECVVGLGEQRKTEQASAPTPEATLLEGAELYGDRWMFHGPEYQGVRRVIKMDKNVIVGELAALPAPGALLDCAGQLLGFWVMKNTTIDRLAMPILIERLDWYENPLKRNQSVECRVHIKRLTERQVRADMELFAEGQTLFRIQGWTDQRFDTNALSWPIIRYPEKNLFSRFDEQAYALLDSPFETAASQDYFHRRYLNESERRAYQSLYPNQRYSWLAGRITAKDAVRKLLCTPGEDYPFPVEFEIRNDELGAPFAIGQGCSEVSLSIAHKERHAVAIASKDRNVGIDIELIEKREPSFYKAAFTESELAMAPKTNRDMWATRIWCAKEAYAKATGQGLEGRPKAFEMDKDDGVVVHINGHEVYTHQHGAFIVAYTHINRGNDG
ncbi:MAG: 4'-phosphopantetheinyl transferase superfamily protein, partial [Bradymonadia bacterium]